MTDLRDWKEPFNDLELLVREAGSYVQASADLRPRVLESARAKRSEHRVRRGLCRITVCVLLCMAGTVTIRQYRVTTGQRGDAVPQKNSSGSELGWGQMKHTAGDASWGTVEAFTEFRRRQAEALRSSP